MRGAVASSSPAAAQLRGKIAAAMVNGSRTTSASWGTGKRRSARGDPLQQPQTHLASDLFAGRKSADLLEPGQCRTHHDGGREGCEGGRQELARLGIDKKRMDDLRQEESLGDDGKPSQPAQGHGADHGAARQTGLGIKPTSGLEGIDRHVKTVDNSDRHRLSDDKKSAA